MTKRFPKCENKCVMAIGHTTPHRCKCGQSWNNRKKTRKVRAVIFGSRGITDLDLARQVIESACRQHSWTIIEVVSGCCKNSPDDLGELWAYENSIPVKLFPADWDRLGKSAGIIRNTVMAEYADVGIGLWDGKSNGTYHMKTELERLNKMVHTEIVNAKNKRTNLPKPNKHSSVV